MKKLILTVDKALEIQNNFFDNKNKVCKEYGRSLRLEISTIYKDSCLRELLLDTLLSISVLAETGEQYFQELASLKTPKLPTFTRADFIRNNQKAIDCSNDLFTLHNIEDNVSGNYEQSELTEALLTTVKALLQEARDNY